MNCSLEQIEISVMHMGWAPVEVDVLSFELGSTADDLIILDSMLVTYDYVF